MCDGAWGIKVNEVGVWEHGGTLYDYQAFFSHLSCQPLRPRCGVDWRGFFEEGYEPTQHRIPHLRPAPTSRCWDFKGCESNGVIHTLSLDRSRRVGNRLVCDRYGLTEEEIEVVEGTGEQSKPQ